MYLNTTLKAEYKELIESDFIGEFTKYADLNAERLYRYGREAYDNKDFETAKKCETLNRIVNNCVISSSCFLDSETRIAYGGVGVLIHPLTKMGKYGMIGTNVTIGAAPVIGNCVYISTGARLIGVGIKIGSYSVIGANAVVTKDVPPFSIVAGVPAKIVGTITPKNVDKYLKSYLAIARHKDEAFMKKIKAEFIEEYNKLNPEKHFSKSLKSVVKRLIGKK
ncbi:hypothetical protein NYE70_23625 [Paenibacillus sp. FSL R5-0407]|uniref:serine O-acetyltransferase n=1 Tax=Paenibacillus sp. FSL R5-0407 TaxID=2975320 RepID=UPI0030F8560E